MELIIELIVHGVPSGQRCLGVSNEDVHIIESFYHKYNYDSQLFVDSYGSDRAKKSMWYTYVVNNTIDTEGRAGGYFGLSLKINQFYSDIANVYNILDATFRKFFQDEIFKEGTGFRYKESDFSSFDKLRNDAKQQIVNYFTQFSVGADLRQIPNINNGSRECPINLLDCAKYDCYQFFLKYGKLVVSPQIQLSRERTSSQDKEKLLKDVQTLTTAVENEKKVSQGLRKEMDIIIDEKNRLSESNKKSSQIKSENESLKKKLGDISNLVSGYKNAPFFDDNTQIKHEPVPKGISNMLNTILTGSVLILCLFCLGVLLILPNKINKIVSEEFSSQMKRVSVSVSDNHYHNVRKPVAGPDEQIVDNDKYRIDIENTSDGTMTEGFQYAIKVINKENGSTVDPQHIQWKSNNDNVSVTQNGKVYSKKAGGYQIEANVNGVIVMKTGNVKKARQ